MNKPDEIEMLSNKSVVVVRKNNTTFNENDDIWRLAKCVSINMGHLKSLYDDDLHEGIVKTLSWFVVNKSPLTTKGFSSALLYFGKHTGFRRFDKAALLSFKTTYSAYAERLKVVLLKWHALGYPGLDDNVALIKRWKFKTFESYKTIKGLDPKHGPLSDIELENILSAIKQGYEVGEISLEKFAIILLLIHTGRRPVQIRELNIGDLVVRKTGNLTTYTLTIPRAKQRNTSRRKHFRRVRLPQETGRVLVLQAEACKIAFEQILTASTGRHVELHASDRDALPLFPAMQDANKISSIQSLREELLSDNLYLTTTNIGGRMAFIEKHIPVISHRTNETIHITARRLRYTLGTRAAMQGLPISVVAEMLDHSNVHSAQHYFDDTPVSLKQIDLLLNTELTIVAQSFAGKLITSPDQATRKGDQSSLIRLANDSVGNCGTNNFCPKEGGATPCYTCRHFEPWLDGPHEKVLQSLLEERANRHALLGTYDEITVENSSPTPVMNALDALILAIHQVVTLCSQRKEEIEYNKRSL